MKLDDTLSAAIVAEGLWKSFGAIQALKAVDLEVKSGTVLALLGPNGSGKTTLVRVLTTLLTPDKGKAFVAGHDILRNAASVRRNIGLAGQYAAVDEELTGRENLEMVANLYHMAGNDVRRRAGELLEVFGLTTAGGRRVKTYSGGMRRRLDLAASLVGSPQVLFLDEPTAGLDPRSRRDLWDTIAQLVSEGMTLLLTTQYMEEADRLADTVAIIDSGAIVARGTPAELKMSVGGEVLYVRVSTGVSVTRAAETLASSVSAIPQVTMETGELTVPLPSGTSALFDVVRRLEEAAINVAELSVRQPTLDDVFLALTGRAATERSPS